jgi:hypothetical protein
MEVQIGEAENGVFRRDCSLAAYRMTTAGRPNTSAIRILTPFGHFCGIQRKIGPVVVLQGMLFEGKAVYG